MKQFEHNDALAFIKEVAKYFMDFLETDFHKRRTPKRSIQLRSNANLLIGLNLNKYPSFGKLVWKEAINGFCGDKINTIQKGAFHTNIPDTLLDLIRLNIAQIDDRQVSNIIVQLTADINNTAKLYALELDQALTVSIEKVSVTIKAEIVLPFVKYLEKPLLNLSLGDENNIYLMEEELTSVIVSLLENKISELLKLVMANEIVDVHSQLQEVFDIQAVKADIISFFENLKVGDLFDELYELERNKTILDKQEFYLYFCDITYNNSKYPIFYIPLSIERSMEFLTIEFDSQVFINKKALEYITQEYNKEANHHGSLQSITERIIYLANHRNDFKDLLKGVLNEIVNYFKLDDYIDLDNPEYQVAKGFWVRISNARYITLFDKSDEALVNDYEEILKLLASGDTTLAGAFNQLIEDFIHKDPVVINTRIDEEWDDIDTSDRLVFASPIPLNSEQLQILSAIKKDECKYVTVEGPPGTGKSHTITAIAFNYILRGQSILILSDKKEALDVVEDKITDTLNKVRIDKNFQNPLLRLGKTGSTYNQILATATIENIKAHLRAIKNDHTGLESDITKAGNSLKEDLQAEILAYDEIDLNEIYELFALEDYFVSNGFPFNINEALENSASAIELEELRSILNDLRSKIEPFKCHFSGLTPPQALINKLNDLILILNQHLVEHGDYISIVDFHNKVKSLYQNSDTLNLTDLSHTIKQFQLVEEDSSSHKEILKLLGFDLPKQFSEVSKTYNLMTFINTSIDELNSIFGARMLSLSLPIVVSDYNFKHLQAFIDEYRQLKIPLFGYLFCGNKLERLNAKFKDIFDAKEFTDPHRHLRELLDIRDIAEKLFEYKKHLSLSGIQLDFIHSLLTLIGDKELRKRFNLTLIWLNLYHSLIHRTQSTYWFREYSPNNIEQLYNLEKARNAISAFNKFKAIKIEYYKIGIEIVDDFLNKDKLIEAIDSLKHYLSFIEIIINNSDNINYAKHILARYPVLTAQCKIDDGCIHSLINNGLINFDDDLFFKFIRYLSLYHKTKKAFNDIPEINYALKKRAIEELITAQMTYLMDARLIEFYEGNRATAKSLREIIRQKRRFPRDEFLKLKEAFPCILAGIRDYAEYIPLEPGIFDLVIIDEASQVSIAQAFPALLRARKVLILGDKKQFSNIKSTQARTDTNREYLNSLKQIFIKCVSNEDIRLVKLDKFNIKTSILEFFEYITNYNSQLLKHFRGYKEIISYSNKYIYKDSLQVMKIRGKAIDDVLRFTFIDHDGRKENIQNTNRLEIEFILSELQRLSTSGDDRSVGIITPHTNQQKLIMESINKCPEKDNYYDRLSLKIMTFDTCQGEERDIIYYSMVATENNDHLWGVFIKDINSVDIEEDGKIKAQRLNVGFSRAKECMHFVLSKEIDKYNGAIGEALRHYHRVLGEGRRERSVKETDENSIMESKVLNWFYQTKFWNINKENIDFFPQFELGKYLKQLDKTYDHPNYRVDFLLIYKDEKEREHKIIIEYDGFREHFKGAQDINEFNYTDYYTEDDVYREKVLESYGYKFLRINKFNVGDEPISRLNDRIIKLTNSATYRHKRISHIHRTIENIQNGEMKECPKCKELRAVIDFRDPSLLSGYGRFCFYCKTKNGHRRKIVSTTRGSSRLTESFDKEVNVCPQCGAKMVLRNGRYGKFYGCSRFPYCRETQSYQ